MGKTWLFNQMLRLGVKKYPSQRDELISEAKRRFEVRVEKRYKNYSDMDYYGDSSYNKGKKVNKDTFLFGFFESYARDLGRCFRVYNTEIKGFVSNSIVSEEVKEEEIKGVD